MKTRNWLQRSLADVKQNKWLYIFVLPGIAFFFTFCYIPMYGVLAAFQDFKITKGVFGSKWIGLLRFREFFNSPTFSQLMVNTVCISLLKLLFGFPAPIILALLFNEVRLKKFKRVTQTISYLPFFLSWSVAGGIWMEIFAQEGPINQALRWLGVIDKPVLWMGLPNLFWGILVGTDIWKGVGFGSVLYLAALTSVDPCLYESAVIDGANRLQKMWHISLPTIAPVMAVQFILSTPGILSAGFDQIMVMRTPLVNSISRIIDIYVYEMGIVAGDYTAATVVGLFKSVIGLILLLISTRLINKFSEERMF